MHLFCSILFLWSYVLQSRAYDVKRSFSEYSVGDFTVTTTENSFHICRSSDSNRIFFQTAEGTPFLSIANATVAQPPISDGNYQLEESVVMDSSQITIDSVTQINETQILLEGKLLSDEGTSVATYVFYMSAQDTNLIRFDAEAFVLSNHTIARLFFSYWCDTNEAFYGFGESFTNLNLKGRVVPVLVSEQGVGRGLQPITDTLNNNTEGTGGHWYTTYAPKPVYITNQNRSIFFHNSEITIFDLTAPEVVSVEIWSSSMSATVIAADSVRDVLREMVSLTGRMITPPQWTQKGAIVGLEGGTANVSAHVLTLQNGGVPLAGVWLQDWVGLRHNYDGDRLIWNWELNTDWYPNWTSMTADWAEEGTRVLTYLNPFFSDPSNYSTPTNNFYQEGIEKGYFVKHSDGSPYKMYSLSIEFCMLDLTNPDAWEWMINDVIIAQSIDVAGSSGWMCDFGEYLPFDALLYSGEPASSYHNKYPQDWAKLTAEAVKRVNRTDDIMYFMRSAWTKSPEYVPVFWLGDQLMSWDEYDGLRSVVLGALSSGLTGHTITHSDIGGYNVETNLGPDMTYIRSEELLARWEELSAFGSGIYRTHIGSSMTPLNAQVYDNNDTVAHFAEFANIFANLSAYRSDLIAEAQNEGVALMSYGYDDAVWELEEQYMFGDDFLVAPCMYETSSNVAVYFPQHSGPWIHLWSGNKVGSSSKYQKGMWITVPAPLGFPPVFYLESSGAGHQLREFVQERGYTEGYEWVYAEQNDKKSDSDDVNSGHLLKHVLIVVGIAAGLVITFVVVKYVEKYKKARQPSFNGRYTKLDTR